MYNTQNLKPLQIKSIKLKRTLNPFSFYSKAAAAAWDKDVKVAMGDEQVCV